MEETRYYLSTSILDSCQVSNGGCGSCATCSHDATTNAVKCTIKAGYTNTGNATTIICTGKALHRLHLLKNYRELKVIEFVV